MTTTPNNETPAYLLENDDTHTPPPANPEYKDDRVGPWFILLALRNGLRHMRTHAACEDHVAMMTVSTRGYVRLAVADGVGSGARGDVCSRAAAEHAVNYSLYPVEETASTNGHEAMKRCIAEAEYAVKNELSQHTNQLGATMLVTAWLNDQGQGHLAHVGDARAYLCSTSEVKQLTQDHTYGNTGEATPVGRSPKDPARMIGVYTGEPDVQRIELQAGQALLLCSDGLYGYLTDEKFNHLLQEQMQHWQRQPNTERAKSMANEMIQATLNAGSDDDISMILAIYWPDNYTTQSISYPYKVFRNGKKYFFEQAVDLYRKFIPKFSMDKSPSPPTTVVTQSQKEQESPCNTELNSTLNNQNPETNHYSWRSMAATCIGWIRKHTK